MAGISHADQDQFPLSRQHSGGPDCSGSGAVHGSGPAVRHARYTGVAEFLLQEPNACGGTVPGTRFIYSVNETKEYASVSKRRGPDYPPWDGVLRLTK